MNKIISDEFEACYITRLKLPTGREGASLRSEKVIVLRTEPIPFSKVWEELGRYANPNEELYEIRKEGYTFYKG